MRSQTPAEFLGGRYAFTTARDDSAVSSVDGPLLAVPFGGEDVGVVI